MKLAAILFVISIAISFLLLNPSVKKATMNLFLETDKKVLSQLEFKTDINKYKVLKVMTLKGLAVEIYKETSEGLIQLDSKELADKKDAFYKFGEKEHNLFLKDINGDGKSEIILPSLDKNMKARLNVFVFDDVNEELQKVTQH